MQEKSKFANWDKEVGKKNNEIMVEDRETTWKGRDVKANLPIPVSISSCDTK